MKWLRERAERRRQEIERRQVLDSFVTWVERNEDPRGLFVTGLRGKVAAYLSGESPDPEPPMWAPFSYYQPEGHISEL
jgi:hypothetical protein